MFGSTLLLLFILSTVVQAQTSQQDNSDGNPVSAFRPSIAIVIGVLSIMFSLTFLLLIYAKFCYSTGPELFTHNPDLHHHQHVLLRVRDRLSGIDKNAIESLPFFRFSSLKGSKEGLECAVCLSKFEDTEFLRLLPKCKHAFHIDCIDRWLESHSSCPLCRYKIDAEDLTMFTYTNSLRFFGNTSERRDDSNLELYVQREPDVNESSSKFSVGSSSKKSVQREPDANESSSKFSVGSSSKKSDKEVGDHRLPLHKFKHRIVVSDVVFKNRWSDFNSSDLMFLNSDMLNVLSSRRFSSSESKSERFFTKDLEMGMSSDEERLKIREESRKKRALESQISRINRSTSLPAASCIPATSDSDANSNSISQLLIPSRNRSMSEIINLSRFAEFGSKNRNKGASLVDRSRVKEEKVKRVWLPIVRRTVQWFLGRERRSQPQYVRQLSMV